MKTRAEATGGEEERCPRCGLPANSWTGQGFTWQGNIYCCQGCAEGTGCICKLRKESKQRRPLKMDEPAVDEEGTEGEEEISNEGRHLNLEKLLYEGGGQTRKSQPKRGGQRIPRGDEMEQIHCEDAERGTDYENDEGSRLQRELRSHATRKSAATIRNPGDPSRRTHSGATDWQDFEDYRPGYSGHQTKGTHEGGVFPRENFQESRGGHAVNTKARKKVENRRRRKAARRKTGSSARRRRVVAGG